VVLNGDDSIMHVNISDIAPLQLASGIAERTLLRPNQTVPGGLSVRHHVVTSGELVFDEPDVEYQHYVIAGSAVFGMRLVHGESAIFVPGNRRFGKTQKHSFIHQGESELRILTITYKIPRPNFRWAKTRIRNLYEAQQSAANWSGYAQIFSEEEHAVMGALRMHAVDVQTEPPLNSRPEHNDPETVMYFLRGTGEVRPGDKKYQVRPGSLIYAPEGVNHGIYNTSDKFPLQYLVVEFVEQDKMWTERAYQRKTGGTSQ